MNRRTMFHTLGLAPFAAIPLAAEASIPDPPPHVSLVPVPEPVYAEVSDEPGNRAAQFAIASAMSFFHGVMADNLVPLEMRIEAAKNLAHFADQIEDSPLRGSNFDARGGY
jgi:hypothetical protein